MAAVNAVRVVGTIITPVTIYALGAIATAVAICTIRAVPNAITSSVGAVAVALAGVISATRRSHPFAERPHKRR